MNKIIQTVHDWISPLPDSTTVTNLESLQKLLTNQNHPLHQFDVSIEWVEPLGREGGHYAVRPNRPFCCPTEPTEAQKATATRTKKAMLQELRGKLSSIKNKTVGGLSRAAAIFSTSGQETEEKRQRAISQLESSIERLEQSHDRSPGAPVDREFLESVFSQHQIADMTNRDSEEASSERSSLLTGTRRPLFYQATAASSREVGESKDQITEGEIREITGLINGIVADRPSIAASRENIGEARRRRANQAEFRQGIESLSPAAQELVTAIRKNRENWIDTALNNNTPITFEEAAQRVIEQFS